MAQPVPYENHLRDRRTERGWSQEKLARRAGLSRAGVSAIETDRLVPSTAAALALAAALGCRVEDLFRLHGEPVAPSWAWAPRREHSRYWAAEVAGAVRLYPVEPTALGMIDHDGVLRPGAVLEHDREQSRRTLVLACCDPAVGLLAARLARLAGVRLLALPRPSRQALELLGQQLVHVAGVHLSSASEPEGNGRVVLGALGSGFSLLRAATWEEGIACAAGHGFKSLRAAVRSDVRWIGREPGSGARQCLDELLGGRKCAVPCTATDHRGVAEAVKSGWADAGVCLRLVTEEAGLDFLGIREEAYDLCFPAGLAEDPRIRALLEVVRSPDYRKTLAELPGYDSKQTGEICQV
ncbi:MAG: substrate-binding domain-containing protein [Isosphaeraceae bacterium]